ncbi:hypothetical protein FRB90_000789 [Tulasnella sp. 427]|nr:hypothetical protein FRB90_000789 [Tulasnella sp. 427]
MMERAGAQILTCHGRTREQRGHKAGLADWQQIAAVKKAVSVPVFANGNVLYAEDVDRCLAVTGADAYMSAEPQLHNPGIFYSPDPSSESPSPDEPGYLRSTHPPLASVALEYLSIVRSLKTPTSPSAIKAHLFRLFYPAFQHPENHDLRSRLGTVSWQRDGLEGYEDVCREMERRMNKQMEANSSQDAFPVDETTGLKSVPHWLCQPKVRPPHNPSSSKKEAPKEAKATKPPSSPTKVPSSSKEADAAMTTLVVLPEGHSLETAGPIAVAMDDEVERQADVATQDALSALPSHAGEKRDAAAVGSSSSDPTGSDTLEDQGVPKRPRLDEAP